MKKVLLAFSVTLAFTAAGHAQRLNKKDTDVQDTTQQAVAADGFTKGDLFASGTLSYSSTTYEDLSNTTFVLAPRLGFFVGNNVAIGAVVSSRVNTQENYEGAGEVYETTYTTFSGGAFVRFYFSAQNRFNTFIDVSGAYTSTKNENDLNDIEYKTTGFTAGVTPGINYFISKHFALEASYAFLNYTTSKPDVEGDAEAESTDTFSVGFNLSNIAVGLLYKF
jgi:hypothetical protein